MIDQIGTYIPNTNLFSPDNHIVKYNAGEYLAIQGTGLNAISRIRINGKPAPEVTVQGPRLISFRVPDNTIGTLDVSVSNLPTGSDAVSNKSIRVDIEAQRQLSLLASQTSRAGDLLMLAGQTEVGGPYQAKIYTTADGPTPVLLATIDFGSEQIHAIALSGRYALFSTGNNHELVTYDITNIYAPKLINRIYNPSAVVHGRLNLSGETFVAQSANNLHVGHVQGAEWEDVSIAAIDTAIDNSYVYLLFDNRVEARPIHDLTTVAATHYHLLINPTRLSTSPQRLLLQGQNEIELIGTATISILGQFEAYGYSNSLPGLNDAVVGGELLASIQTNSGLSTVYFYDIDLPASGSSVLGLREVAQVYPGADTMNAGSLRVHEDLFEWNSADGYNNVQLPMPNISRLLPEDFISVPTETVWLQVSGPATAWDKVVLDVLADSNSISVNGDSQLLGDKLQFRLISDQYQLGETYSLSLFNSPAPVISGGQLQFDLPWHFRTADLFGITPALVNHVQPATTVTNRPTRFTVMGQSLDQLLALQLNAINIPMTEWTISPDGTELAFDQQITQAGIYSLHAQQAGHTVTLPAAIVVAEALSVNAISTDSPRGLDRISDAGGTRVTLAGMGFEGELHVHLLQDGTGFTPGPATAMKFTVTTAGIEFTTPPVQHGVNYRVVVQKPATSEQIDMVTRLLGVDDTAPMLTGSQGFDYYIPAVLTFDEAVQATGFSVMMQSKDYSGRPILMSLTCLR